MFAFVIRRCANGLWFSTALYTDRHGQTVVTSGWHRDRADAANLASYF